MVVSFVIIALKMMLCTLSEGSFLESILVEVELPLDFNAEATLNKLGLTFVYF